MARKTVAEIQETPKSTFETSSKDMVIGLIALGHKPYRIEAEGRVVYYRFDKDDTAADVNRLLIGEDVQISYHKFIAANATWAMNLTRANELLSA